MLLYLGNKELVNNSWIDILHTEQISAQYVYNSLKYFKRLEHAVIHFVLNASLLFTSELIKK